MSGLDNLLERLRIIKDIDPFNKQLLNDCYDKRIIGETTE
jgi:hypothetical protein